MDDFDVVTNKAESLDEKGFPIPERGEVEWTSATIFYEDGTVAYVQLPLTRAGEETR
jgi:hypothetical protein